MKHASSLVGHGPHGQQGPQAPSIAPGNAAPDSAEIIPWLRPTRPLPPAGDDAAAAPPAHDLRLDEAANIHQGAWFAGCSDTLRRAILSRAQLCRVANGTRIARRGDPALCWYGVARGAVRLGTALADGRAFTLDFVGPSQWFGDIGLVDGRPLDLDVVAHGPATLLVVPKADLAQLLASHAELREALLQLNCQRLRHLFHRFEELHTLSLAQRLARQVQRLARQFGRVQGQGYGQCPPARTSIELNVSQTDLAAMVGGSRQRVNRIWRQLHQLGIVERGSARLLVLDAAGLAAVAEGKRALPELPAEDPAAGA